jgi:hypothetical protein
VLIPPVGRGRGRETTRYVVFSIGLLAGGVSTSAVLWGLSGLAAPLSPAMRAAAVAILVLVALGRDLGWLTFPLPQRARLIPRTVFHGGVLMGPLRFGVELGMGVRTYVTSSLPYLICLALVLLGRGLPTFLLVGAAFGAGRALMPLARLLSTDRERWEATLMHSRTQLVRWSSCVGAAATVGLALRR